MQEDNGGPYGAMSSEETRAEKALLERKSFSIRYRITVAFGLAVLFSFGFGIMSILFIARMDSSERFFEQAEGFAFEIQEARRYEKNAFLYGARSDLYDALSHVHEARRILDATSEIRSVLEPEDFARLTSDLESYEKVLNELAEAGTRASAEEREPAVEERLRLFGHRILMYAEDTVKGERSRMHSIAGTLRMGAIFALVVNLLVMIWVATELSRQILKPLGRAVRYTQRIAQGDFSLIRPARKYRDEFSDLAIAINRMIHELRRHQEQLLQSRKMSAVGTLTSGIAHELNNPLNNISITAEALIEGYEDYTASQRIKMLRDIYAQTERASDTVRNLLDFTRIDSPRLESVEVRELIESTLRLVGNEMTLRHVRSEVEIDEDLPRVLGHSRNLQQVFLNLFLNAVQAMPEGGRLLVRAGTEESGEVRIDVVDTGCGIPPEIREKIFDPFFTTRAVGQGTGLGLSVSYGVVQKVGGRIEVESVPGRGTTFSVYLKVSNGEA